jgi:hypothetical protein
MVARVFLVVGLILIGVGVYIAQSDISVSINKRRADPETAATARYAIGGGLGGLGLLFAVGGVRGMIRGSRELKRKTAIMQTGIEAEGTITFVDKNYRLLVNKQPIYSIVEYTYVDSAGKQHTRRTENVPSDIVIRKQLAVGGKVPIKYSAQNAADSVLVIA